MTDSRIKTLADALPEEIKRVKEEVIPAYKSIGISGIFALTMMENSILFAENAVLEQDVVKMIQAYKDLREYKT